jgi:hypothetical protein
VDWLGIYPTWETLLAQLALLILLAFALLKTFWPQRSVTLPVVEPAVPASAASQVDLLAARVEALERRVGRDA